MVIFRFDAGPIVYSAFIGFQSASSTTPVKTTVLSLARLPAVVVSDIDLLREKDLEGPDVRKATPTFSESFLAQLLPSS